MDWQTGMNRAMDYLEEHLAGEIDYLTAAQFMNCSEWEFRRIFSFIARVPLSEYIRRRRLTRAALDIQNGDRLIDVALRYGYQSQAAFSRAFRRLFGAAPSLARDKGRALPSFPRLTFKLILLEGMDLKQHAHQRTNIIGAGEVGCAISVEPDKDAIHRTNTGFWDTKGNDLLGTTALPLLGAFLSEEKHRLFGDVAGKKVLEIGCGRGHSLAYLGERRAAELWGLDISGKQLEKTAQYLAERGLSARLIQSPMEEDCGLPEGYFDLVYSIYGIGWTTDLEGTFRRIAACLKPGGVLIFSWSHPIHKCVAAENGTLAFKKCYFDESWYSVAVDGGTLSLSDRKLSTYVNALAAAGFTLERMVEASDEDLLDSIGGEYAGKAKMLPVTFAVKARKR